MHWEQRGEGSSGLNLNLFQSKDSNGEAARKKLGREFKTCRAMLRAIGNVKGLSGLSIHGINNRDQFIKYVSGPRTCFHCKAWWTGLCDYPLEHCGAAILHGSGLICCLETPHFMCLLTIVWEVWFMKSRKRNIHFYVKVMSMVL